MKDAGMQCKYGPWIIYPDGTLISKLTGRPKKAFRLRQGTGYWNVTRTVRPNGKGSKPVTYNYLLHRLVAEHFLGPIPEGMEVCFKDGDKGNVHADNLEYKTHSDTLIHSYNMEGSTRPRLEGERNPKCKVSDERMIELKARYEAGECIESLATEYGITPEYVLRVCRYRNRRQTTVRKRAKTNERPDVNHEL